MANDAGSNEQMHETNVVIVGCGPVGTMLANLLGLQGISTLVLEREAAIYNLPRAVHFDDEVMRLLQTVGLAETMQRLVHVSPGMKFVDDTGRLLLDWARPLERSQQGWHASYRFHQPELERVLRDGLSRWRSVSLKLRTEVFALEQEFGRGGGSLRGPLNRRLGKLPSTLCRRVRWRTFASASTALDRRADGGSRVP